MLKDNKHPLVQRNAAGALLNMTHDAECSAAIFKHIDVIYTISTSQEECCVPKCLSIIQNLISSKPSAELFYSRYGVLGMMYRMNHPLKGIHHSSRSVAFNLSFFLPKAYDDAEKILEGNMEKLSPHDEQKATPNKISKFVNKMFKEGFRDKSRLLEILVDSWKNTGKPLPQDEGKVKLAYLSSESHSNWRIQFHLYPPNVRNTVKQLLLIKERQRCRQYLHNSESLLSIKPIFWSICHQFVLATNLHDFKQERRRFLN